MFNSNSSLELSSKEVLSNSPSEFATNNAVTAAPVTLVAVLTMSIMTSIPRSIASPSIGSPKVDNTTVAAIDAVPGTPAIPMEAKVVVPSKSPIVLSPIFFCTRNFIKLTFTAVIYICEDFMKVLFCLEIKFINLSLFLLEIFIIPTKIIGILKLKNMEV